jgi:hypothetical protein
MATHLEEILKDLDPGIAGLMLPMLKEVILDNCDKKGRYVGLLDYLICYKRIVDYQTSNPPDSTSSKD